MTSVEFQLESQPGLSAEAVLPGLELMLFENDPEQARRALEYGIDSFLIDWEQKGKDQRQCGYDTQILPGTALDLEHIAAVPGAKAWCRLNRFGPWTADEVETASYLEYIRGRCSAAILIETLEAAAITEALCELPLQKIYFGLNDFAISRGDSFLFKAVFDGTVESVRKHIGGSVPFGFGGVTSIQRGTPIPCIHLIQELARLQCSFSFLRRSFKRDLKQQDPAIMVHDIEGYWTEQLLRTPEAVERDREQLLTILAPLCN